ncbi:MAG: hypothetical protein FD130_1819 [Halothiobacillaceae bacterium]|nr:MAG: hypothetical protein FD130_1819 [Halothiobacillaceae bacterium]
MRKTTSLLVGCLLSTTVLTATHSWADDLETYKITITNLTPGQPFAPILAASHHSDMSFFTVGQAPNDELAMLAEAGNGNPMATKLRGMLISARRGWDRVSIGAMLGATNDAFFAVTDVALPKGRQIATYIAEAYDAGSETNDELCATVPGCGGAAAAYSPDDHGEGFVHIHNGIHGIGDLSAAKMDWRPFAAFLGRLLLLMRVDLKLMLHACGT